jgi:DNA (cytosine-5)-methyltransferase 1
MSEILLFGDLFAGGGGTTEGVLQAARLLGLETEAIAVNHWPVAVATHVANHGHVRHHCMDLETASPRDLVPGGRLDLLWASPECTHHSRARGGKPVSEQKRAGANWVLDWLEALDVRCLILENVVEWLSWGDVVDDKPVSKTRGKLFVRWWNRLKRLGYRAEYRVLNAADYGDATTRRRLFVQARKDGRPIRWPEPTHSKTGAVGLFGGLPKWKPAREIIDWTDLGPSLFDRVKPLSLKTRLRIGRGLQRFGGELAPAYIRLLDLPAEDEQRLIAGCSGTIAEAFTTSQFNGRGHIGCRPVSEPATTITTVARIGLATPTAAPFTFANREHGAPKGADQPIATATTASGGGMYVVAAEAEPFVLGRHGGPHARNVDDPAPTSTGSGGGYLVNPGAEPFVLGQQSDSAARSTDGPIPTVATAGVVRLFSPTAEPFLDVYYGTGQADSIDEPTATVTATDRLALVSPFAVPYYGEAPGQAPRVVDLADPLDAVTTAGRFALVSAFLSPKFGERPGQEPRAHGLDEPAPTVTGEGAGRLVAATMELVELAIGAGVDPRRLILVDDVLFLLDICFRMLKPEELAAAMGFPPGYRFTGTKTDVVRQIGNAVCVGVSRALVLAMFGGDAEQRRAS